MPTAVKQKEVSVVIHPWVGWGQHCAFSAHSLLENITRRRRRSKKRKKGPYASIV